MRPMPKTLALISLAALLIQPATAKTYANPVDIDYRYNFEQLREWISYRTGADPVLVNHKGRYYLFVTLADGYWVSDDLIDWTFVTPSRWPSEGVVAPAGWSDGEKLYMLPSRMKPGALYSSADPASGRLDYETRLMERIPGSAPENVPTGTEFALPSGPWDPSLFKDDDGRWFLYWGSSNVYPLYGIELDPARGFAYIGKPVTIMALHPDKYGWERFGQDHEGKIQPFTEGAWMTKVGGKYYFQYGAPGTEYNAYSTGLYVGDSPLGPFKYAAWNPIAYKPGGFVIGAGHGSVMTDRAGNDWLTGTPWVGQNWNFERRVGLWPMQRWADGEWSANTRFGDFPHHMPDGKTGDVSSLFTGWMLLSYRKPATASSTLAGHPASLVSDENPRSFWVARENKAGETLTVDLGTRKTLRAIQVNFADYRSGRFGDAPDIYTEFRLEASIDGKAWRTIAKTEGPRRDRPNAYFELARPEQARFVRYVHDHVGAKHLAISDIRVFGTAGGKAPRAPVLASAVRGKDTRNAAIRWSAVPGAVGYNVRWGIRADRLSQTYQRWADEGTSLNLRALTVGQEYWVAVEAFDENGVSVLSEVKGI